MSLTAPWESVMVMKAVQDAAVYEAEKRPKKLLKASELQRREEVYFRR